MIEKRIAKLLSIEYEKRLLIFDTSGFRAVFDYTGLLISRGFEVVLYEDIEVFRFRYEQEIRNSNLKYAVIVLDDLFVPYDVRKQFFEVEVSIKNIFPKLNEDVLKLYMKDIDLISYAYEQLYTDCDTIELTEKFISEIVFSKENIKNYCELMAKNLLHSVTQSCIIANDWINVACKKALIDYYAARVNIRFDTGFVDNEFEKFIFNGYQKLSGETKKDAPAILPKVIDFIAHNKTAIIVIDGMSLFDFEIVSRHFEGIDYEYFCTYALIPTTTAISRQSLLSGKYPCEIKNPFQLAHEEKLFIQAAQNAGYSKQQILYTKGFDPPVSNFTKFIAVIINDIDDMMHGQKQGRVGMYNDVTLWAKSGKLQALIRNLYNQGFNIYITSDHGNTPCIGTGGIRKSGVEVETKSKRMFILKDFAEEKEYFEGKVMNYPGYYLDKDYRYYICKSGISFDNKNEEVITHGGISIDEVIVPFIKVKVVV